MIHSVCEKTDCHFYKGNVSHVDRCQLNCLHNISYCKDYYVTEASVTNSKQPREKLVGDDIGFSNLFSFTSQKAMDKLMNEMDGEKPTEEEIAEKIIESGKTYLAEPTWHLKISNAEDENLDEDKILTWQQICNRFSWLEALFPRDKGLSAARSLFTINWVVFPDAMTISPNWKEEKWVK